MFETKIKPDYSEAIAKFVKIGGQIKQAINAECDLIALFGVW